MKRISRSGALVPILIVIVLAFFAQRIISPPQQDSDPTYSDFIAQINSDSGAEQIKSVVEEAAQSYEHPEEVVRWYYAQPQRLAEIEGLVIEDNVVEWALSSAKVLDKAIVFDELMGQGQRG